MGKLTAPLVIGATGLGVVLFSKEDKIDKTMLSTGNDIPMKNVGYGLIALSVILYFVK